MNVNTVSRPYLLTFHSSGHSYPATSEEAQRLIDGNPVVTATRNKVVLQGDGGGSWLHRVTLRPATRGGGPAFVVTR